MESEQPEARSVPTFWMDGPGNNTAWVNQFAATSQPGELTLVFGQLNPPLLAGEPDEQRAQLDALEAMPIAVVAKLALTRRRAGELLHVLRTAMEQHDAAAVARDE